MTDREHNFQQSSNYSKREEGKTSEGPELPPLTPEILSARKAKFAEGWASSESAFAERPKSWAGSRLAAKQKKDVKFRRSSHVYPGTGRKKRSKRRKDDSDDERPSAQSSCSACQLPQPLQSKLFLPLARQSFNSSESSETLLTSPKSEDERELFQLCIEKLQESNKQKNKLLSDIQTRLETGNMESVRELISVNIDLDTDTSEESSIVPLLNLLSNSGRRSYSPCLSPSNSTESRMSSSGKFKTQLSSMSGSDRFRPSPLNVSGGYSNSSQTSINWKTDNLIFTEKIGRGGGAGIIYKTLMVDSGVTVACKLFEHFENDDEEARQLADIIQTLIDSEGHKNVYKILALRKSLSSSRVYLFMEYFDRGKTLKDIIDSKSNMNNSGLSKSQQKYFSKQIAEGLKFVHGLNMIHRDIKSKNIFAHVPLPESLETIILKIGDMDDACYQKDELPLNVGTIEFMAPEMASQKAGNGNYTSKVDIWAYGLVIYEITSGKEPFRRGSIIRNQFRGDPPSLTHTVPKLPSSETFPIDLTLQTLYDSCTKKNPRLRPTAEQCCRRLER